MKLILTRDVPNLGAPGDVVTVKNGYGRNYLIPQGMAMVWTRGGEAQIAAIKRARKVREIRDQAHAEELKDQLQALQIKISARAGETGHLFGRVTPKELVQAIRKAGGPDIDYHHIKVDEPIKHVGEHTVNVDLPHHVVAKLAVEVSAAE